MQIFDWIFQTQNTGAYWLIYSIICIGSILIILSLLPPYLKNNWTLNALFFGLIAIPVFLYGLVIVIVLTLILIYRKMISKKLSGIETADYPDFQHSPISQNEVFGEGFGFKVATTDKAPKAIRKKMLIAINQFESSLVNKINSQILTDDVDEMRLYAKNLIEKQERALSKMIKRLTNQLAEADDAESVAYFKKQKALVLWEQVYKHLIQNENISSALEKIQILAKEAIQVLNDDLELPVLLAKIAIRNHALDEAEKWLEIAKNNQAPVYKVASYQAEIEFLKKHYANIKIALADCNNAGMIGLQPVASFWVAHD